MKVCQYCGQSNEDTTGTCAACGTQMVASPQPGGAEVPDDPLVIVQTFSTPAEAAVLAARLKLAGIKACVPEQEASQLFSNVAPLVHATVRVAAKDAEVAKAIADALRTDSREAAADLVGWEEHEHDPQRKQLESTTAAWFEVTAVVLVLVAAGAGALSDLFRPTRPGAAWFWVWLLFTAGCLFCGPYLRRKYQSLGKAWVIITSAQLVSLIVIFALFHFDARQGAATPSGQSAFQVRLIDASPSPETEPMTIDRSLSDPTGPSAETLNVRRDVLLDGSEVVSADVRSQGPRSGPPVVEVSLTNAGRKALAEITRQNIGRRIGIIVAGRLITAPRIEAEITTGTAWITGRMTLAQARELAAKISAGAKSLPLPSKA